MIANSLDAQPAARHDCAASPRSAPASIADHIDLKADRGDPHRRSGPRLMRCRAASPRINSSARLIAASERGGWRDPAGAICSRLMISSPGRGTAQTSGPGRVRRCATTITMAPAALTDFERSHLRRQPTPHSWSYGPCNRAIGQGKGRPGVIELPPKDRGKRPCEMIPEEASRE